MHEGTARRVAAVGEAVPAGARLVTDHNSRVELSVGRGRLSMGFDSAVSFVGPGRGWQGFVLERGQILVDNRQAEQHRLRVQLRGIAITAEVDRGLAGVLADAQGAVVVAAQQGAYTEPKAASTALR